MYYKELINIDFSLYKTVKDIKSCNKIVIGDLHSNAFLFIDILIQYGIIKLKNGQYDYDKLKESYLVSDQIDKFKYSVGVYEEILKLSEYNSNLSLIFIGDTLADRGKSDYLILLIYEALSKNNVEYSIVISNHDFQFIIWYFQYFHEKENLKPYGKIDMYQMTSLMNLIEFINDSKNHEFKEAMLIKIKDIVMNHYFTKIKLLDHALTSDSIDQKINIFVHAIIEECDILKLISLVLGVEIKIDNALDFVISINEANNIFIRNMYFYIKNYFYNYHDHKINILINKIIWNRDMQEIKEFKHINNIIHGHTNTDDLEFYNDRQYVNLDSEVGKQDLSMTGERPFVVLDNNITTIDLVQNVLMSQWKEKRILEKKLNEYKKDNQQLNEEIESIELLGNIASQTMHLKRYDCMRKITENSKNINIDN